MPIVICFIFHIMEDKEEKRREGEEKKRKGEKEKRRRGEEEKRRKGEEEEKRSRGQEVRQHLPTWSSIQFSEVLGDMLEASALKQQFWSALELARWKRCSQRSVREEASRLAGGDGCGYWQSIRIGWR
jgi:hypothetical protein